jgi:hypothetical protein
MGIVNLYLWQGSILGYVYCNVGIFYSWCQLPEGPSHVNGGSSLVAHSVCVHAMRARRLHLTGVRMFAVY